MSTGTPLISIRDASKRFGGAYALDHVDFDVRPGEIHALLGENGAGKSTLAKVMAGAVQLTSGMLHVGEEERHFRSPHDSMAAGIALVYQETSLIPAMTVAQNLRLGHEPWFSQVGAASRYAGQALDRLDFVIDPLALVETLGPAQRQMVEIARAVSLNATVLIFDEPTASLSPDERDKFFALLRMLRQQGKGIVFITHALEEALSMSDRITVLRDGKRVACGKANRFDRRGLVKLMVGRELPASVEPGPARKAEGEAILVAENIAVAGWPIGMSFSLRAGEVVGFAGLVGSGRSEAAKAIAGVLPRVRGGGGTVYLRGKPVEFRTPAEAIAAGVVYVTEDRKTDGLFETMTARENLYLSALARRSKWEGYSRSVRDRMAEYWRERLGITALNRDAPVVAYSGGNQQKVLIAKALAQDPDVIFFDEPTRGVDVGAIPQIHQIIRGLADEGKAVVVISSYLPEILSLSDRVLVAREGQIVAEFTRAEASEDQIMHAAAH